MDDNTEKIKLLGKIDVDFLVIEFGRIQTDDVIITDERLNHIMKQHPQDFLLFEQYVENIIQSPDLIIKDMKHSGTVFMIKRLKDTNLNVVVRIALVTDNQGLKNSVMTCYRVRDSNLAKLIKKNKLICGNY